MLLNRPLYLGRLPVRGDTQRTYMHCHLHAMSALAQLTIHALPSSRLARLHRPSHAHMLSVLQPQRGLPQACALLLRGLPMRHHNLICGHRVNAALCRPGRLLQRLQPVLPHLAQALPCLCGVPGGGGCEDLHALPGRHRPGATSVIGCCRAPHAGETETKMS